MANGQPFTLGGVNFATLPTSVVTNTISSGSNRTALIGWGPPSGTGVYGTAMPAGTVSDEEWAAFLRDVVTPRFPQGLTSWPASGQWRTGDGNLAREASHVLNLVHADDEATERAIQAIVSEYKEQFRQEAIEWRRRHPDLGPPKEEAAHAQ